MASSFRKHFLCISPSIGGARCWGAVRLKFRTRGVRGATSCHKWGQFSSKKSHPRLPERPRTVEKVELPLSRRLSRPPGNSILPYRVQWRSGSANNPNTTPWHDAGELAVVGSCHGSQKTENTGRGWMINRRIRGMAVLLTWLMITVTSVVATPKAASPKKAENLPLFSF